MREPQLPSLADFRRGWQAYEKKEQRDSMYKVATYLVNNFWGKPTEMADALGVLLATWNNAFYRYGPFSYDLLQSCIEKNLLALTRFRSIDVANYESSYDEDIAKLFNDFLAALKISSGKVKGRASPVATAKALHLLAPRFFPIWDDKISKAYGCYYSGTPSRKYIDFIRISRKMAIGLAAQTENTERPILKLIDEYNYAKYTKKWI